MVLFNAKKLIVSTMMLVALFVMATAAQAQTLSQRYSPRIMQGVRPLGMGDAFIAVKGTDPNALFYNPAAINDYEDKFHFQFQLPTAEISYKAVQFFASDIPDLADDVNAAATDAAKIDAFDTFAATNTGRYEEVGVRGALVTMMHKYVSASLFYDTQGTIGLLNPASSTVDVEVITQLGLAVGSAYSFFDDALQVGATVKFMERHLVDETITQRDVITNADFADSIAFKQFGFGIGFDLGVKGAPPIHGKVWEALNPTFALVLQDVGHTRFFAGDPVGQQKESLNFGMGITPKIGPLETNIVVDFRELEYRTDFITKLHAGVELTWPEISKILRSVSVRGGTNQGYLAAGLGLDFKYVKLDFATYGREIAQRTYQKHSQMFAFQIAGGF